jgi:hypothetical protein
MRIAAIDLQSMKCKLRTKKTEKGSADRVLTNGRVLIIDLIPMAYLQAPLALRDIDWTNYLAREGPVGRSHSSVIL